MSDLPSPPTGALVVIPSAMAVGETFSVKVRLLGETRPVPCAGNWNTPKPGLRGPFNLNVSRRIQYVDNTLPHYAGALRVEGEDLNGPDAVVFDGENQGAYPGDHRPVKAAGGFSWTRPGFRFLVLKDEQGRTFWSNPAYVSPEPPAERIFWGDPHWQTFFSDGIRCPEELFAFARDEGFLDFGALSDHMEAVTDRQWEYFVAVTNDYNAPGRFATLLGQEWTNHDRAVGCPGHRNIYYRGDRGPVLRSTSPDLNTLEKLWARLDSLDGIESIAIPHHPANERMGVDWSLGWNPKYEKAVEIHSVWGSSERHADEGNPFPIKTLGGEVKGKHVLDALKMGYRLGFVGGGDIHDGRPGDNLTNAAYPDRAFPASPQGFTAAFAPALTRECVFDAMRDRRTYATTASRIYLDAKRLGKRDIRVAAASEHGIARVDLVRNGVDVATFKPDSRALETQAQVDPLEAGDFLYARVTAGDGAMAWSSPEWGEE